MDTYMFFIFYSYIFMKPQWFLCTVENRGRLAFRLLKQSSVVLHNNHWWCRHLHDLREIALNMQNHSYVSLKKKNRTVKYHYDKAQRVCMYILITHECVDVTDSVTWTRSPAAFQNHTSSKKLRCFHPDPGSSSVSTCNVVVKGGPEKWIWP